jgi:glycosyltransferase involved in cell wall biosynthesis
MKRIAYYFWRFPLLSETFIQREFIALRGQAGLVIRAISDERPPAGHLNDELKVLAADTVYVSPLSRWRLLACAGQSCLRRPPGLVAMFRRIRRTRYLRDKNLRFDLRIFLQAIYLADLLQREGFEHVHAPWSDLHAFIAALAAARAGISFSCQARAHDLHRMSAAWAMEEKFSAAAFIVTNTKYNIPFVRQYLPENNWGKVHQIYNGVPLSRFVPAGSNTRPPEPIRLLAVGRLVEQKGFHFLLDALAMLRDRGVSFQCNIVGGPELPQYQEYFDDLLAKHSALQLENCVTFALERPFAAVLSMYSDFDLFVLPCVIESDGSRDIIPNAVLEAMAMGLPVVSTAVTGVPELVDHGKTGLLVEPGDAVGLCDALYRLSNNATERQEFGLAGRDKMERVFDIDKNIQAYAQLFRAHAGH